MTQRNIDHVVEALSNAVDENGYVYLATLTDDALADDLITCDADCETMPRSDVLAGVKAWRDGRK